MGEKRHKYVTDLADLVIYDADGNKKHEPADHPRPDGPTVEERRRTAEAAKEFVEARRREREERARGERSKCLIA